MAMQDDRHAKDLIERAQQGDRSAFDALFSAAHDSLSGFARARMGIGLGQHVDPEDILQETFLRAFRSIGIFQWDGDESFLHWLEGITAHVLADEGRLLARKKELQIPREPVARESSPSQHSRRRERLGRLRESVASLSPAYQEVIVLSRIEGLTIREIAERTARSESVVRNLLFRAMKELKKSFGDTESFSLGSGTLRPGGADNAR